MALLNLNFLNVEELTKKLTEIMVKENIKSPIPNDPSLPQFIPPYIHYVKDKLHYIEKGKSGVPNPDEETPEPITFTDEEFDEVMDKCVYKIVEEVGKFCFGGNWRNSLRIVDIVSVMETLIGENKIRFIVTWYMPPYIVEGKSGQSTKEFDGGLDVVFDVEIKNPSKEDVLTFLTVKGLAGYRLSYNKEADEAANDEPEKPESVLEEQKKTLENNKAALEKSAKEQEENLKKMAKGGPFYEKIRSLFKDLKIECETLNDNCSSFATDVPLSNAASIVTTSTGAGFAVNAIPIQISNLKKFAGILSKSISAINSIMSELYLDAYADKDPTIKAAYEGTKTLLTLAQTAVSLVGG